MKRFLFGCFVSASESIRRQGRSSVDCVADEKSQPSMARL